MPGANSKPGTWAPQLTLRVGTTRQGFIQSAQHSHLNFSVEYTPVSSEIESELGILAPLDPMMHPYREQCEPSRIPQQGIPRAEIVAAVGRARSLERDRWKQGYASGSVYHGDSSTSTF